MIYAWGFGNFLRISLYQISLNLDQILNILNDILYFSLDMSTLPIYLKAILAAKSTSQIAKIARIFEYLNVSRS